tara:strand:+ start:429 stop:638 length:210 start_codon:yes stop_codon:yes gene_type:complete
VFNVSGDRFEQFRCPIKYRVLLGVCSECKNFTCIKNPKFKIKESLGEKTPVKKELNQLDTKVPKKNQNV